MKNGLISLVAIAALSANMAHGQAEADTTHHTVQFVTVDKDVKLEVLDWGGEGRPLVFLSGLGSTAHVYDQFAPQFTAKYHVYGITRRGWGDSSKPAPSVANYAADRLGDDVLAVIDTLKLNRPVLVGHSIAGEELSSIGNRHPEKVAGLIYLDAADAYGYYDQAHGDWFLDMLELRKEIDALQAGAVIDQQYIQEMLANAALLEKDTEALSKRMALMPGPVPPPPPPVGVATRFGEQKYTQIHGPVLAIFACPHNFDFIRDSGAKAALIANDLVTCTAQANAFEAGVPTSHVVRLPNADHYIFRSNAAGVARAMNSFLAALP
ncbi:MAG: alpha/beta hydrolase [Terracidiphilus sp.]|jgi:pimeloyl-ACP methyl ester carboxylesterase